MSTPILYKGNSAPDAVNPGGISVLLPPGYKGTVDIVDPKGNVIKSLARYNTPHIPEPGEQPGQFGSKYYSKTPGSEIPAGSLVRIQNPDGSYSYAQAGGAGTFRGSIDPGEGTLDKPAVIPQTSAGGVGSGGGNAGIPNGFSPGHVGQFGSTPAYLGNLFPDLVKAVYQSIPGAKYAFTDPQKFAEQFGQFNRGEVEKNFNLSSDLAMKELNTELKGLESFVPAADALKKSQTASDNAFNIAQRLQSTDQALPGVRQALQSQGADAATYAKGDIPNSVLNRAMDISTGSSAADTASSGGFGARSSTERRLTDLMSVDKRLQLSQYGNSLIQSNASERANLFLPPTEYGNSGTQLNVNPSQSASQLIGQQENALNGAAILPTSQALSSTTQQNQFSSSLDQQTQMFNASNQLQLSEFNSSAANQFALDKFGYNAGFANQVAGAQQNDINTQFALNQQQQYMQFMMQYMQQSQNAAEIGNLFKLGGSGLSALFGGGGLTGKGGSGKGGSGSGSGGGSSGFTNDQLDSNGNPYPNPGIPGLGSPGGTGLFDKGAGGSALGGLGK